MLRSALSILLSVVILMQGLNVHLDDVLDVQVLLEHMEYHESSYGDGLFAFVQKHYGAKKTDHEEKQNHREHEKLPFKNKLCQQTSGILVIAPIDALSDVVNYPIRDQKTFHYQENYSFLDQVDIFQPPRTI